ncbi:SOS response associated peptidase (SRAP) [Teratosphaeria destructans]|uniref:SOS response associated peptidase (SRAP) n=1 Tax=Teratosphaeria destructans TaxID=418781 RepID=A0A9W7SX02_9PEZI|nr:SOS response associated peptidase (SRAP) [Teratosphaeria destructans]
MCGRYALSLPPSRVRQRLADQNMPADQAPEDDDDQTRQTYNFAPGYHGLIYRADTSDRGNAPGSSQDHDGEPSPKRTKLSHNGKGSTVDGNITKETRYKLQAVKWGLIPFWTKRPPDYGSQMRTINCRDDSLIENRGMWNTMKQRKRCIVVAEGFYEWLKKNGGKEKIPHFTKRKDGQLMCFAGLWDMVQYEGSEEKLYTYTIITTDSNKQLSFLHDRMPVILEPGSEEMKAWLDPNRTGWDKELQGMLKPFQGELDCYPVDKGVGKVGNNSPQFVVPVDSKENKKNIANFFGKQKETAKDVAAKNEAARKEEEVKQEGEVEVKKEENEDRATSKVEEPETNAPLPKPKDEADEDLEKAIQASLEDVDDELMNDAAERSTETSIKREVEHVKDEEILQVADKKPVTSKKRAAGESPVKETPAKKTRSATSNQTVAKSPAKGGNAKITKFFGK